MVDLVTLVIFFHVVCEVKCVYMSLCIFLKQKTKLKGIKKPQTQTNQENRKFSALKVNFFLCYCIGPTMAINRIEKADSFAKALELLALSDGIMSVQSLLHTRGRAEWHGL